MKIQSFQTSVPQGLRPLNNDPGAPPPQEPKDGVSLGKAAAGAVLGFMGRRIPPTHPEFSAEQSQELRSKMKPGDVILTADMAYPGWARMEFWTVRSNYTHAAILGNDGHVYEAVGEGVQKVKLEEFFDGRFKVAVVRLGLDEAEAAKATEYCQQHLGKSYDGVFNTETEDEFYCSELVTKALESADPSLQIPRDKLLGKVAVAPDAFLHTPGAERVHDDGSHYWKNKLTYWPLATSAIAGGVAGGVLSGVGGAALGGTVGLLGSILVGNKIQTGHWLPSVHELREGKH